MHQNCIRIMFTFVWFIVAVHNDEIFVLRDCEFSLFQTIALMKEVEENGRTSESRSKE